MADSNEKQSKEMNYEYLRKDLDEKRARVIIFELEGHCKHLFIHTVYSRNSPNCPEIRVVGDAGEDYMNKLDLKNMNPKKSIEVKREKYDAVAQNTIKSIINRQYGLEGEVKFW